MSNKLVIQTLASCMAGLFGLTCWGQSATVSEVRLTPDMDLQAAVQASPPGTTFLLAPGEYRMQGITAKDNDVFIGQAPSVVFNGSQILKLQKASDSSTLWVASAAPNGTAYGPCMATAPLCGYSQDLFIDDVLQRPVAGLNGLQTGSWYFDRVNRQIYIASDPSGHKVELGAIPLAFSGGAKGVQISQVIVEKYASHAQQGAIGDIKQGTAWIVDQVEVRWNHGAGIELGPDSKITNSFIHHNGQLGIVLGGNGCTASGNEISWNNYAGYEPSWEAGGSKFWETRGLVVRSNYVHDNNGPGLWTDTNNVNTLYEANTVVNNGNEGIKHEVSDSAVIRANTVKGNGRAPTTWAWNAQIELQNSSNSEIVDNTVEVPTEGGNGIAIINQNRGSGSQGTWIATNNSVHDNTVLYRGMNGYTGFVDDTQGRSGTANSFEANRYILHNESGNSQHWLWLQSANWYEFQAAGQDSHGTCCD